MWIPATPRQNPTNPDKNPHGRYGGLRTAAGEVRKGKPSGTGDLMLPFRTTPAPRWGTANLNRFANRRTPGEPGEWITEAGRGSRQHPGGPRQSTQDHVGTHRKIPKNLPKSRPGPSPEPPESLRDPSGTRPSEDNAKKSKKCGPKISVPSPLGGFLAILGSGREPKITKNGSGDEKVRPETVLEAIFVVFFCG